MRYLEIRSDNVVIPPFRSTSCNGRAEKGSQLRCRSRNLLRPPRLLRMLSLPFSHKEMLPFTSPYLTEWELLGKRWRALPEAERPVQNSQGRFFF